MKKILKKCGKIVIEWTVNIIDILLANIIGPIIIIGLWCISLPIKIVLLLMPKRPKFMFSTVEEWENKLNSVEWHWTVRYSLVYMITKFKIEFAKKFGWAL